MGRKGKHAAIEGRSISRESEALAMATLKAACSGEQECLPPHAMRQATDALVLPCFNGSLPEEALCSAYIGLYSWTGAEDSSVFPHSYMCHCHPYQVLCRCLGQLTNIS